MNDAARMPLSALADALHAKVIAPSVSVSSSPATDPEVRGVTHNSQWVKDGDAFVAVRGENADGHRFIQQAVAAGAVAVIGEELPKDVVCPLPYLKVADARRALAEAAAHVRGMPADRLHVVGVTGTDGKTTTSLLTTHLLRRSGHRTGLISTIGYQLCDGELRQPPQHFTTPEAPQVQEYLAAMVAEGADSAVVESSSHALALERVGGIGFDVGIWTQLTSEHLDFHKTQQSYFEAKRRLIERCGFAVLNADDPWTDQLRGIAGLETTYSAEGHDAQWRAAGVEQLPGALRFRLISPLGDADVTLPMIGRFNVANALAACAAAARLGATLPQLVEGLRTFPGVTGRMELVSGSESMPRVIVDFAHTPPSLEKALETVRATTRRELWVVLGSAGGNRDPHKRAPLGEVATRLADHAVFTEEDHRDTPLQDILDEMARGAREAGRNNLELIGDRRQAIRHAIFNAMPGDTVVLAGKGPEATLERAGGDIPWDEVAEAREALRLRASDSGRGQVHQQPVGGHPERL